MTSATFYDAKPQRTAGGVNQGNKASGVPKHTFNLGARYRTKVVGKPVTFRANIENLLNEDYWLSSSSRLTVAMVAAPRTVLLSAKIEF